MLRGVAFLARQDLRHVLRSRETLLWTFVMPPVFFFFIGTITGGFGGSPGPEPLVLEAPADAGFLADAVARRLAERGFDVRRAAPGQRALDDQATPDRQAAPDDQARPDDETTLNEAARLAIPAGFTDSLLAGARVEVVLDPRRDDTAAARYVEVRAGRAVYGVLADLAAVAASGDSATPAAMQAIGAEPRLLALRVTDAGKRAEPPTGFEQAVPGTMVMFTLIVLLTSGAAPLVVERQAGLLRRLASAPISRESVVAGKAAARLGLALIQISFAALVGMLLFGVGWGPDPAMVALVLGTWAALAAVLGLLLGNLARSPGQAVALGVLTGNLLAALGGCWWPIEITPPWMRSLALFLPTGLTMDALHRLVSFEAGAASALPHVLVLALMAVGAGWLAARTFRFA